MNSGNNSDAFGTNPEENLAKIRQKLQEAHERCERYKAKMAQIKRSYFKLQSEQQRVSNKAFKQQHQQQNLNLPQDVPAEGQSGLKKKQGDSNKEIIKHYVCNARGESCYNVNISDELRYKYVVKDKESVKETKPEVVYSPENYQRVESRQQQQQQQQQQPQMQYQWQPTGGPYYKNKRIQKRPEKSKQKQGQQIQSQQIQEHGQQMQGQQIKEKQIQGQQIQEQQIQGPQQQAHQMQGQKHRQKQANVNAHKTREMVIKGEAYCEMKNKSLEITCTAEELNMQNANSSNIVKVINGLIKNIAGKTINVKGGTDTKVQNVRQKNVNVNKFKSVNKQASKVTIKNNKIRKTDEEEVVSMDNQNQKEQIIYNKRLNDRYNYYKERMHQNTNEAAYVEEQQEQEQMYESDQYENDSAYKNYYVDQTKYTNENNEEIYTQPYENNIQNRKNEDLNNYNQQQLQQARKEQWAKIIHQQNMLNDYIHQQNLQNNNTYEENASNNIYQENAQNNIYQENAQNNIYQENAQNKNNTYRENAHNENIYRENAQNKNIYRDNVQNKNIYRENAQKNNIYRENAHNNNIYQENSQNNDIYGEEYAEENYESLNEDNYKQQEEDTFKERGKGMLNNLKGLYYNSKYKQHQDNINNDEEASYYNNYYQPASGNLPDNLAQNVLNKADVLNYVYTENNYQNQAAYTPNVCYKNNKNKEINSNAKERVCDMEFNAVNATIENTKRAVTKTINDAIKCNATVNAINIDRYVGKIVNNKGHVARYVNKCGAGEKNEVKRKVQSPTMPKSILVNGKRRAKVNLTPKPKQASNNNKKHYPNKGTGQEELEKVLTSLCDSKMIEKLYDDIGDPEIVSGILEQLINITQDEIKKLEIKLSNDRRIKNCLAAKSDRRSANGKNVECACFHSDIATSEEAGFELEPEENVTELYLNALMQDETPSESYLNYINNLTN